MSQGQRHKQIPPDGLAPDYDDMWTELLAPPELSQALADLGIDLSREAGR